MRFGQFHHPSISLPVVRRRVGEEVLELVGEFGEMLFTRGRSLTWNKSFPSDASYRNAVHRLRKAGLIACVRKDGSPFLRVTAEGRARLRTACNPEPLWSERWPGIWYSLLYDVPEKDRAYRESLRLFLKRMRMGQLQRSVWVTPRDIRPEFDDLAKASGLRDYAFLFEFKPTLGESASAIVERAWDFESLSVQQAWFCQTCSETIKRLQRGSHSPEILAAIVREERTAFLRVMERDPLLPRKLWPEGYRGEDAWHLHREFIQLVGKHL